MTGMPGAWPVVCHLITARVRGFPDPGTTGLPATTGLGPA
jgi:hypothetical protein